MMNPADWKKKQLNDLFEAVELYAIDMAIAVSKSAKNETPSRLEPVAESRKKLLDVIDTMGLL